jgi:hypothetical protein
VVQEILTIPHEASTNGTAIAGAGDQQRSAPREIAGNITGISPLAGKNQRFMRPMVAVVLWPASRSASTTLPP